MPTLLHGSGCNLGMVPLVVHYWADSQSVRGFRCYDNAEREMSASACTRSMPGYLQSWAQQLRVFKVQA